MKAQKITAQTVNVADDFTSATIVFDGLTVAIRILDDTHMGIAAHQDNDGPCRIARTGAICINTGLDPVWLEGVGDGQFITTLRNTTAGFDKSIGDYMDSGKMPVLYV